MLMTTLLLGGPPLMTNFFSGQVAATFQNYNAVGGAAKSGGGLPGSPQEMMAGSSGLGANTQQNQQEKNVDTNSSQMLGKQYNASTEASATQSVGARGNANNHNSAETLAYRAVGSSPAAATNRAEEQALVAQKAQASSANRTPAPSAVSTPSAGGTTVADNGSVSTAESGVRIANAGMGDDSAAIKQKYGSRGLANPNV